MSPKTLRARVEWVAAITGLPEWMVWEFQLGEWNYVLDTARRMAGVC